MFYFNSVRCLSIFFLFVAPFNVLLPSSSGALTSSDAAGNFAHWVAKMADLTITAVRGKKWRPIKIQSSDIKGLDLDSMRVTLEDEYVERVLNYCVDFQTMRIDIGKIRRHLQSAIRYGTLISARQFEISGQYGVRTFKDLEDEPITFQEFFWHETGSRTQTIVRLSLLACAAYGFGTAIYQISNKIVAKVLQSREKQD